LFWDIEGIVKYQILVFFPHFFEIRKSSELLAMMRARELRNASLQTLSLGVSRYSTTVEGAYKTCTYKMGTCNIGILQR